MKIVCHCYKCSVKRSIMNFRKLWMKCIATEVHILERYKKKGSHTCHIKHILVWQLLLCSKHCFVPLENHCSHLEVFQIASRRNHVFFLVSGVMTEWEECEKPFLTSFLGRIRNAQDKWRWNNIAPLSLHLKLYWISEWVLFKVSTRFVFTSKSNGI